MAVSAIHPGEHLADELKELGMSAAELARNLNVPNTSDRHLERTARYHRRHRIAPRLFLRHQCGVLAQPADPLRAADGAD